MLRQRLGTEFALVVAGALVLATAIAIGGGTDPVMAAGGGVDTGISSATLLADGRVLVIVATYLNPAPRAQIYDPIADRWTSAGIHRGGDTVATLLTDGRVLLTGGLFPSNPPELYDPRTDTSSPAAPRISYGLGGYATTLLRNGKVLFAGGAPYEWYGELPSLEELYDPATNRWSHAGGMPGIRLGHQALRLADDRVLVVGGIALPREGHGEAPAEVYDPASNTWSPAGKRTTTGASALSLFADGMVLSAGGTEDGMPSPAAEVFNPTTRTWSRTSSMTVARSGASAVLLPDGRVLVLGGLGISGLPLTTGEVFDPHTNSWAFASSTLKTGHPDQAAIRLRDGRLFVTGWSDHWSPADVEIFDPSQVGSVAAPSPAPTGPGTWSSVSSTADPHHNHSATLLADGRVLVLGTDIDIVAGMTGEIYDPSTGRWSTTARATAIPSEGFTVTPLSSGIVLVVGRGAQLYDPTSDRWSPAGTMATSRTEHIATRLPDGRVLVAGGGGGLEIYNPDSNSWSLAGRPQTDDRPRDGGGSLPAYLDPGGAFTGTGFTATLLRNGRVLFIGGCTSKAAVFNPSTSAWSAASSLRRGYYADYTVRDCDEGYTTTLLPNGKVLAAGGYLVNAAAFPPPEVYDPDTNQWSPAGSMLHRRRGHTATLLQNGLVLVAGGYTGGYDTAITASAELYDPASNRWSATESMAVARTVHSATLLRNGKVLVVGGYFLDSLRSAELYIPPVHRLPAAVSAHPSYWPLSWAALLGIVILATGGAVGLLAIRARTRKRPATKTQVPPMGEPGSSP
jgi:N-acetylneuraminic acid mutarotase